ncbi:MAG: GtrA family protein [Deltaproteobacteria bacterium]|nr:GtrA family protein [Deltaproteobacteria bacterium]
MSAEPPPANSPAATPASGGFWLESWQFVKGQVSAGAATFIDWALVTSTILLLGDRSYPLAVALGAVAGACTDFLIKRHWVFDARAEVWKAQAIRYVVVSLASLAWNELLSWVAVDHLGLPAIPGVIGAAVLVGAAWNYPMQRLFVFRRAEAETSTEG